MELSLAKGKRPPTLPASSWCVSNQWTSFSGKWPGRSLPELVAWLKANPDQATFGARRGRAGLPISPGWSLVTWRSWICALSPTRVHRLPSPIYRRAVFRCTSLRRPSSLAGSIRILATLGASRSRFLSDVPTLRESGFYIEASGMARDVGARRHTLDRCRTPARCDHRRPEQCRNPDPDRAFGFEIAATTGDALAQIQRAETSAGG